MKNKSQWHQQLYKILVLCSVAFSLGILTAQADASTTLDLRQITEPYLTIGQALATDSMKDVNTAALQITKKTKDADLSTPAHLISKDKSIKEAREHFKQLSAAMIKFLKKPRPEGLTQVHCSMANASWIQKSGPIMNPYYGKEMQTCGEIEK